jgi:hypothetical protein
MSTPNIVDPNLIDRPPTLPWYRRPLPELMASTPHVAAFYILYLIVAETLTTYGNPAIGLFFHAVLIFVILLHAALLDNKPPYRLVLTLIMMPIIRLMSVAVPLVRFPPIAWYMVVSIPLFISAFTIMRILNLKPRQVGFTFRQLPLQVMIALTGVILGVAEYAILRPQPLLDSPTLWQFVEPSLYLLIGTGLMEELVFRGIIQQMAEEQMGINPSILFSALIFAIMHIGWRSMLDLVIVFAAGVYWGWVFARTRSLVGITISHGITNIMLFLVLPLAGL